MRKSISVVSVFFLLICGGTMLLSFDTQSSDLTKLMRKLEKDVKGVRAQIQEDAKELKLKDYEAIYTAKSSKGEIDSSLFKAYTQGFLGSVDALEKAEKTDRPRVYNAMIDNCMACHSRFCPGPKVRIRKLYLR